MDQKFHCGSLGALEIAMFQLIYGMLFGIHCSNWYHLLAQFNESTD